MNSTSNGTSSPRKENYWVVHYLNHKKYSQVHEEISLKIEVAPIDEKMRESHLSWFGHY